MNVVKASVFRRWLVTAPYRGEQTTRLTGGHDWREQLEQMALEKETAEAMGLTLSVHTPITVQAAQSNHVEGTGGSVDANDDEDEKEDVDGEDKDEKQE